MPDQLFKERAAEFVLLNYLKAKKMEESSRQSAANERLAVYHDDWEDLLETKLAGMFLAENYDKIKLLKNTSQNILKKVVKDVSVVYKVAPTRDFKKNEVIQKIYDELQIDEFMKRVNRYATLLQDVLIQVGWDPELQRITLDLHTPADTSVIQRDEYPDQAAAIYYAYQYIDSEFKAETRNVFWSDYEHFEFNERGVRLPPSESNPEGVNPFGKMPFVIIHMNPRPGMFWNKTEGSDLYSGTTITGVKRTLKDHLFKHQSFKQLWFRVADKNDIAPKQASDPLSAFRLTGENSQVGVLDLTAQFTEMEQTIQADVNSFLSTYGLSIDMFAVSGQGEASGRALNIKNRGLREIREEQLPVFRRVEQELFDMIVMVWNAYNKGKQIPKIEFSIDFAELETYVDPMDKRKQAMADVKSGILSPGKYYMMFNPDVTDEAEAERLMAENLLKYKNMRNQGFSFDNFFNGDTEGDEVDGEVVNRQGQLPPFRNAR